MSGACHSQKPRSNSPPTSPEAWPLMPFTLVKVVIWACRSGARKLARFCSGTPWNTPPAHPGWLNRDRFVLSAGHGSMFLYAWLHLSGYPDLTLEEIKRFRQFDSKTPGHPELTHAPSGVETTTGPLGQGVANAVGMAVSQKMAAARFNTPEHVIFDHHIVCLQVTDVSKRV